MDILPKLERLTKHIQHVQESATILAESIIVAGHPELGIALLQNAAKHDNSKFAGIELRYLVLGESEDPSLIKSAIDHHNKTNLHHPEAWSGGIREMTPLYLAEMCCDWKARSTEFGTDLRCWICDQATEKFGFKKTDRVFKDIQRYLRTILEVPFRKL
jgi:hypothetical protein